MSSVGDFFSAWELAINARDAPSIASLCTEDVMWEDSVLMRRGPLRGRAAVRDFFEEYLFRPLPDLRFEILELIESEEGSTAAERARFSGTLLAPVSRLGFAPTAQPIEFEVAAFFEFREGKAARVRVIVDILHIARQAGAAPLPGTIGDRLVTMFQHLKAFRLRRSRGIRR
jgi:ketosteroid isomerase-like protein